MECIKKMYMDIKYVLEIYDEIVDIYKNTNTFDKYVNYNKYDIDLFWFYCHLTYNNYHLFVRGIKDDFCIHKLVIFYKECMLKNFCVSHKFIQNVLEANLHYNYVIKDNIDVIFFKNSKKYLMTIFNEVEECINKLSSYI